MVRISLLFLTFLFSLALRAASIAVVYAERSVAESERRFAQSLAGNIQRWYSEAGIETDLLADSALTAQDTHALVWLIDCYNPPKSLLTAVEKRLAAGGRFVVCYSASDALGKLFGLKAGKYLKGDGSDWASMSLEANRPAGAPVTIGQTSTNLFTMSARVNTTRPMGWWCNRKGHQTEVAWWKTAKGSYWMTHILSGHGDEAAKRELLLAIAAESIPGIWQKAARTAFADAVAPLTNGSLRERIVRLPGTSPRRQQLDRTYAFLLREKASTEALLKANDAKAYRAVCDLRDLVSRAYGMTYWPKQGEVCGVWDHTGEGLYPGDWPRTAKLLATAGVTDVYVNIAGAGFALYPSSVLPQRGAEDLLRQAIDACKAEGLRVHAWVLCFSCERSASGAVADYQKKGWTLQEASGKELNWLDPTHPAVRAQLLAVVKELARYRLDGIHLDFVRFPGLPQSLGPRIRARYEAFRGQKLANWPACITDAKGSERKAFLAWRSENVSKAVREVRAWLRKQRPGVELSAAVFGKYPACVDSVGQDWMAWLKAGTLDYALPMNYTESLPKLKEWLGMQTGSPAIANRIISGVGVTAAESRLSPIEVLQQIDAARQAKCKGFALFDLDETLRTETLPVLSEGVMKR